MSSDHSWITALPSNYAFRMRNGKKHRWWKVLLVALLGIVFTVIFDIMIIVVLYIAQKLIAISPASWLLGTNNTTVEGAYLEMNMSNPFSIAAEMLTLFAIVPALGLAMRIMGYGGLRTLSSVEGKFRWHVVGKVVPWMLLVYAAFIILPTLLDWEELGAMTVYPAALVALIVLVPLQCAGEEYMCRGFLLQGFAAWMPKKLAPAAAIGIAMVLQSAVFASLHGYNLLGLVDVGFSGLCWSYIAVKTGGVEIGITCHACNNVLGMVMQSLFVSQTVMSDVTIEGFVFDVALSIAVTVVAMVVAKRKGLLEG